MTPEVRKRIEQIRRGEVPEGYKRTGAEIAPSDWKEYRLGEIYIERKSVGNPYLPILSVSIHSGVSVGELDENELGKKVKRIADKAQYKIAFAGDLVLNMMRAWQGAIGVAQADGLVSPAYIVATPKDVVFPQFMDSYMKTLRMIGTINRQSYGVTDFRKRLYWDSFAPICCALPSIAEQQKIASILTTQDKVIELQQRKIEELQKLKRVCLQKMFPKKGASVPEVRFPGFTEAWEQRKLSEVLVSLQNNTLSRAELSSEQGAALNVHYGDVLIRFGEYLDIKKEVLPMIPDSSVVAKYKASFLQNGDVIVADTAEDETVGKCSEMAGLTDEIVISGLHTIPYRPLIKFATSYLGYYMNSHSYHHQLLPLMQGIKVTSISKSAMQNTSICYPKSESEQADISTFFRNLDNLITLHQRKLDEMKKYKKALMQLLLTGIVRVDA